MGGDITVSLRCIEKIVTTSKPPVEANVTSRALIKGLENHNLASYLIPPVTVLKAFGIKKLQKCC